MTVHRKLARHWPEGLICALIISALVPVFATPGFLILLDWAWAPAMTPIHIDNTNLLSGIPIQIASHMLIAFFSSETAQKIILALCLMLLGTGAIAFTRAILPPAVPRFAAQTIALSGGIFSVFNPFTINRISLGHINFLFGYVFTFWALAAMVRMLENPNKKRAIIAGIILVFPLAVSIHHTILLPIAIALLLLRSRQYRSAFHSHAAMLILPSAAYIIALAITGYAHDAWAGHRITTEDASAFALQYPCTSSPIDIAALSATWRPSLIACPANAISTIGWIVLAAIMLYGTTKLWAWLLIGIAILLTYLTKDIAEIIPAWGAMRDSGKFISLLVIAEAALLATGSMRARQNISRYFPFMLLLAVCAASIPAYSALSKNIIPSRYPQSWYEFSSILENEPGTLSVLFLPQAQYVSLQFTRNTPVANPAPLFFDNADVIVNPEQEIPITPDALRQKNITYLALLPSDPRGKQIEQDLQSLAFLKKILKSPDLSVWQFVPPEDS